MSILTNRPQIVLLNRDPAVHPDRVAHIAKLRSRFSCLWMDEAEVNRFDPHLQIEGVDPKKQPLRIIWIRLDAIDFSKKVFSDEYRRNTIVITTDQDIAENAEIAFKLEQTGIGLMTQGQSRTELKSVLKTLTSLKLKSLLIEGTSDSEKLFADCGVIDFILADAKDFVTDL